MRMNVTQEAIISLEKDSQKVLRFPQNRKQDSKDKDARFRSLFGAPFVKIAATWELIKDFVRDDVFPA